MFFWLVESPFSNTDWFSTKSVVGGCSANLLSPRKVRQTLMKWYNTTMIKKENQRWNSLGEKKKKNAIRAPMVPTQLISWCAVKRQQLTNAERKIKLKQRKQNIYISSICLRDNQKGNILILILTSQNKIEALSVPTQSWQGKREKGVKSNSTLPAFYAHIFAH